MNLAGILTVVFKEDVSRTYRYKLAFTIHLNDHMSFYIEEVIADGTIRTNVEQSHIVYVMKVDTIVILDFCGDIVK